MKTKLTTAICILFSGLILSSCATIFGHSKYPISFNSTPSGAKFTIENRNNKEIYTGTTPDVVKLQTSAGYMKKEEYKITFTKEGFDTRSVIITSTLNGWYIGNILLGGLIGMLIVDPVSGAMYKIAKEDRSVDVKLNSNNDTKLSLQIIDIENLPEGLTKSDLVRIN